MFPILIFTFYVLHTAICQGDLRCFLLQGGSLQNFFVNESLPIGSPIGTLNIGGDAGEAGDIYLRIEATESPVHIPAYSKDLILTEKLDKEGILGKSHVIITVICQKRNSDDLDTRIPVVVRVTDSNDNAPRFYQAPYFVNVSEATVVGTVILGDIYASDDDQNGPFSTVQYSIAEGPHSDKFAFESPISAALQLTQPLDYEDISSFNLTIIAQDQGNPAQMSQTYITVQVEDSDDQNPAFRRHRYSAFLPENITKGNYLEIQPESINAYDQDKGIQSPVIYSLEKDVQDAVFFSIEPQTGRIYLSADVPKDDVSQPIVLSIVATQIDNPDRVVSSILTISRRGPATSQLQFVQRQYEATVLENLPLGSLVAQTIINKNDFENIKFFLEGEGYSSFVFSDMGRITIGTNLDFEETKLYNLRLHVTDTYFNDTAFLRVQVVNVNEWDPRFQFPEYKFHIQTDNILPGDAIGEALAADGDKDLIEFSIIGKDADMFDIDNKGKVSIKKVMNLNSTEAHVILVAKDNGIPPRQTSAPVTIYVPSRMVKSLPLQITSNFLIMVIFGCLLIVFFIIIACLVLYIHKNKKLGDDNKAALPTKLSQILPQGGSLGSMDPSSQGVNQNNLKSITGVEQPEITTVEYGSFKRNYTPGLRASTISVQSQERHSIPEHSTFQTPRKPMSVNEGSRNGSDCGDNSSLNGSNATTASTATVDSHILQIKPYSTFDGTVRAMGGLPSQDRSFSSRFTQPSSSFLTWNPRSNTSSHSGKKIIWPTASIPKRVKKLSWEDEFNGPTEMDPEVSVTPMQQSNHRDTPNLTVYF